MGGEPECSEGLDDLLWVEARGGLEPGAWVWFLLGNSLSPVFKGMSPRHRSYAFQLLCMKPYPPACNSVPFGPSVCNLKHQIQGAHEPPLWLRNVYANHSQAWKTAWDPSRTCRPCEMEQSHDRGL